MYRIEQLSNKYRTTIEQVPNNYRTNKPKGSQYDSWFTQHV
jgi:hypothetical protein